MINSRKHTSATFWLLYVSYAAIYVARINLSIASPSMRSEGIISAAELGFMGSIFSIIYACGRLFNGFLGDRVAPKILIFTGLIFTGASNLLIGILPMYVLILGLWCLNAFGQSMLWSAVLRTISSIYGASANRKNSILGTSISLGNVVGILLCNWLVSNYEFQLAFVIPGVLTMLCGLMVLRVVPPISIVKDDSKFHSSALTDKRLWGVLLPAFFHGAIKNNISLWMAVYFMDRFSVNLEGSTWYLFLIPLVGLVGGLIYPSCYKLARGRENMISVLCFIASAGFSFALCIPGSSLLHAAICLSMIYVFVSMITTSFLAMFPLRFADSGYISSVGGIADFVSYLGASVFSVVYGFFIDAGPSGYMIMFFSWAIISILSVILLLPLHPFSKE